MLFSNMDFRFYFAHCEIEESFGLIWVKLWNDWLHLQISSTGIYCFIFAHFVYKVSFGQIWVKTTGWSIRLENFHFDARFTNYGVPFCSFWI